MENFYTEKEVNTWEEFKVFAEGTPLEWIYRGESNSSWTLKTTLDRYEIIENFYELEDKILKEFQTGSKFYLNNEFEPKTKLEWYSMLQHYGAPSRLLDFTKSPYIAAYFAFENAKKDADKVAIWIIDKNYFYQKAFNYLSDKNVKIEYNHENYTYNDTAFETIIDESKMNDLNFVFPVEPNNQNERYHRQQAIFIAQGNPFELIKNQFSFLNDSKIHKTFMKVTIPVSEKKNAIRDLIKMNITRATLFPGLDGFAKSLVIKFENLLTITENFKQK